jgi:hypothetical protein
MQSAGFHIGWRVIIRVTGFDAGTDGLALADDPGSAAEQSR